VKIKLTYIAEEEPEAAADLAALLRRHPGARVRRDKSGEPQKQAVYVTVQLDRKASKWYNKSKE